MHGTNGLHEWLGMAGMALHGLQNGMAQVMRAQHAGLAWLGQDGLTMRHGTSRDARAMPNLTAAMAKGPARILHRKNPLACTTKPYPTP